MHMKAASFSAPVFVLALTASLGCEYDPDLVDCSTLSMPACAHYPDCEVVKAQQLDLERGCQREEQVPKFCQPRARVCSLVVATARAPDSTCWVFNQGCGRPGPDDGWTNDCNVVGSPPICEQ